MKSWILKHKVLSIVLACVILAGIICAIVLPIALNKKDEVVHEHTYAAEWSKNETDHWHAATCEHTSEVSDKAAHVWDAGVITKEATATENGEKTYTCTICQKTKKVSIDAIGAQENTLTLKDSVTLGKTYDGQPVSFTKEMFEYNGNGEVTFTYKAKDAAVFTEDVPYVTGEYVVKVSVAGTNEWKEVEKEFDFDIAKVHLASIEKAFEMQYDGTTSQFDLTSKITEKVDGDDIKLVVKMNGFTVGSTIDKVEFTGDDAYNYVYDTTKLSVEIGKAIINIRNTQYDTEYKSGVWKTIFELTTKDGVVQKDGVLEDVDIEILKDNDWANNKTYALYIENTAVASNIERVKLVGDDADNYCFECTDDGNLGATLYCKIRESVINGTLDPLNEDDWGGINYIDNITFADNKFIIRGAQGEITDIIIDEEYNYKQLKFVVFISGTSTIIAEGTRILWEEELQDHVYTGCALINVGLGGPADMEFYLKENVDGYTDENGYWICEQEEVNFNLKVEETTTEVTENQELFKKGLIQGGWSIVKYKHTSEDASFMRVELTEGSTGTIETHIYGFVNGKFTELEINGLDYEVEKGKTYYIVMTVRTAGTGNAEIVLYN